MAETITPLNLVTCGETEVVTIHKSAASELLTLTGEDFSTVVL